MGRGNYLNRGILTMMQRSGGQRRRCGLFSASAYLTGGVAGN
jgi:hypothetical protein